MSRRSWVKLAYLLAGGGVLLQVTGCGQFASSLADLAQIVTAGGVIYLVSRVME
jgi:hypothetical protein